jgi:3-deoxy-manno-octulosonate cytidylyltransferase (CMP-KDO synthetase)
LLTAVAVIPARYHSTRLPGKPLVDIVGRPMIEHVYRRTALVRGLTDVLVATDDARIVEAVQAFGGRVRLTRTTHQTGSDRIAEVARELDCAIVVNVQGDEPFIEPAMIEQALEPFAHDPTVVMTTLRRRITEPADLANPNVVKIVADTRGDALYFSRAPIPFERDPGQAAPKTTPVAYRHVGLYAYRRDFLLTMTSLEQTPLERLEGLEQLRVLEHGYRIRTVETSYDSISVDTPEDLERARRLAADLMLR